MPSLILVERTQEAGGQRWRPARSSELGRQVGSPCLPVWVSQEPTLRWSAILQRRLHSTSPLFSVDKGTRYHKIPWILEPYLCRVGPAFLPAPWEALLTSLHAVKGVSPDPILCCKACVCFSKVGKCCSVLWSWVRPHQGLTCTDPCISGAAKHLSLQGTGVRAGVPGPRHAPPAGPVVPTRQWNPGLSRLPDPTEK